MHAFDIVFGSIVLVLVFLGIRRGFVEEVMRLTAIVIGFIGAFTFYRHLIPKLSFLSHSPHIIAVVSFLIVFFCIAFGIVCIGKIIKKMIKLTMMGWLDRLCGAGIGVIKAFFLGWIFVITVSSIPVAAIPSFFKDSRAYSFFVAISPALKTKVMDRVSSPSGVFSRFPVLGDLLKKMPNVRPEADSKHAKGPSKKTHPIEEKKR
jgi:membrane protein required for colicin V production